MPVFGKSAEGIVLALGKAKAFSRETGKTITNPTAAAPLVTVGYLDKATKRPAGGSQTTIYWLTEEGRAFRTGLQGPRCRYCSCTTFNACKDGCHWVKPGVCSNPKCVAADARQKKRKTG